MMTRHGAEPWDRFFSVAGQRGECHESEPYAARRHAERGRGWPAGLRGRVWFALVAPSGTPPEVRARLNAEVKRALALPDVRQRYADLGMTAEDSTPDGLDAYIKAEIAKWTKVIKEADIRAPE
jgi:hypothetical protein